MTDVQSELRTFNNRLKKISEALEVIKKCGMGEEILIAYLCHNLKISQKKAEQIILCYDDFYKQTIRGMMVKSIQKEETK